MPMRGFMRWTAYVGVSTALAGGVILKALAQRPNFYSAAVYLSQSSANLMILTNLAFMLACAALVALQKLFYGPLRPIEIEQLYEKGWFAITETCLAMTIFRGEIGAWFLIMFFSLLAGKVWQWIGEGRVEILEQQPPRNPRWFHTRLALSLGLSVAFDLSMLDYVVKQVMKMARPDMMVMFGFEFAVLSIMSLSTAARYAITLVEISIVREQKKTRADEMKKERITKAKQDVERAQQRQRDAEQEASSARNGEAPSSPRSAPLLSIKEAQEALRRAEQPVDENEVEVEGWEAKGRYTFYLDLATDFFKLLIYLSFFVILLVFYGLPIHIMRDVFLTTRSFFKRISDFMKYRNATRDMNERYPDATEQDIGREDVCIICREEMRPYQPPAPGQQPGNPVVERMRPKKLPCGHTLHFSCLRSWLERQQVCPTCRRPVLGTPGANLDAHGQPAAPGAQAGQHPPAQGPRVFQLGPLRIGVGAARGNNMFEELQQHLQDGRPGEQPRVERNGPQQYGFGIRWDGRTRRGPRRRDHGSVRDQLDRVEQQIQDELRTVTQNTREYILLRNMQTELDRVRAERNGNTATPSAGSAQPTATATIPQTGTVSVPPPTTTIPQRLQVPASGYHIQAGSPNLPAGMTLPEGWSMVPLRPAATPAPAPQPVAGMHIPAFTPQPAHAGVAGAIPIPDHIRAMFANMPGQAVQPLMSQNTGGQENGARSGQQESSADPASAPNQSLASRSEHAVANEQSPIQDTAPLNQQQQPQHQHMHHPRPNVHSHVIINGQRVSGPPHSHITYDSSNPVANALREQHETYLRSLRTPEPAVSGTSTVSPIDTPTAVTPVQADANRVNGVHREEPPPAIPRRSFGQPSPVTPQPLPMWGSSMLRDRDEEHQQEQDPPDAAKVGSLPRSEERSKQPTVEDLVEGPD